MAKNIVVYLRSIRDIVVHRMSKLSCIPDIVATCLEYQMSINIIPIQRFNRNFSDMTAQFVFNNRLGEAIMREYVNHITADDLESKQFLDFMTNTTQICGLE